MFNEIRSNSKIEKVLISTGNILNVLDTTTAPLRKSHEELLDSLKLCAKCVNESDSKELEVNGIACRVLRATQELKEKITENDRNDISIGAKLFLNSNSQEYVQEAVRALMTILNVDYLDNLILAYHPHESNGVRREQDKMSNTINNTASTSSTASSTASSVFKETQRQSPLNSYSLESNKKPEQNEIATPTTPTTITTTIPLSPVPDNLKWSSRNGELVLQHLKELWNCLEDFALHKKIQQLGISDLDIEALTALCDSARVEPAIAQINQSNCCVVPSALKEFCTQHEIQLLTHNDPEVLLNDASFMLPGYKVAWSLRYQVHVRCRGVLTAKGYILSTVKDPVSL